MVVVYFPDEIRACILSFLVPFANLAEKLRQAEQRAIKRSAPGDVVTYVRGIHADLARLVLYVLSNKPFVVTRAYDLVPVPSCSDTKSETELRRALLEDVQVVHHDKQACTVETASTKRYGVSRDGDAHADSRSDTRTKAEAPSPHGTRPGEKDVHSIVPSDGSSGSPATTENCGTLNPDEDDAIFVKHPATEGTTATVPSLDALAEALEASDAFLRYHTEIPKLCSSISNHAGELLKYDLYQAGRVGAARLARRLSPAGARADSEDAAHARGSQSATGAAPDSGRQLETRQADAMSPRSLASLEEQHQDTATCLWRIDENVPELVPLASAARRIARHQRMLSSKRVRDLCAGVLRLLGGGDESASSTTSIKNAEDHKTECGGNTKVRSVIDASGCAIETKLSDPMDIEN
ncbi:unnamed protein product [Amoebophrya sp. A120]|nr:unnamed protein product [Amoebophrya sp. A120]|eukprot:GSA120T00016783001.1